MHYFCKYFYMGSGFVTDYIYKEMHLGCWLEELLVEDIVPGGAG